MIQKLRFWLGMKLLGRVRNQTIVDYLASQGIEADPNIAKNFWESLLKESIGAKDFKHSGNIMQFTVESKKDD